jgi:NAD(P)-dependent dehydrogenase (short-subunit alcohol dehydrogenase family)
MTSATSPSTPASLRGAHVVVFGGSTGIGLATARAAKASGARITLVGRAAAKLEAAAATLGGVRTAVADIVVRDQVEALFADMGGVDHLVITAGALAGGRLAEADPDLLLAVLQERIAGPLYAIKAALPRMPPTGSIVLTGGQFSDRPAAGFSVVSAAVRGLEALAGSLALELRPIRVNVIAPGFVDTPLFDGLGDDARTALLTHAAAQLPGGRIGRADEVADAILLLLRNGYLNGEVLHVDGGGRLV